MSTRVLLVAVLLLVLLGPQVVLAQIDVNLWLRLDHFRSAQGDEYGGRFLSHVGWRDELGAARLRVLARSEASRTPWGQAHRTELEEMHVTWINDQGIFRVGLQQIAWGRADVFQLLDTVNARRYPDALFEDTSLSRIPSWMIKWEDSADIWEWQLFLGTDRRQDAANEAWPTLYTNAGPRPEHSGSAHVVGGRLGSRLGALDIGVYALDGPDQNPVLSLTENGVIWPASLRRRVLGLSADLPVGPIVWRAEATQKFGKTYDIDHTLISQQQTKILIGADTQWENWFASAQLYREATSPQDYQLFSSIRYFGSALLERGFWQDQASFRLLWLASFDGRDDWLSLKFSYQSNDHLEWQLQVDHFNAKEGGTLYRFNDSDRLSIGAVNRF